MDSAQQCARCGLDLNWVKWRKEGLIVICAAILLGAMAFSLSSYSLIEPVHLYYGQTYVTHPYAGLGSVLGFIAAVLLIAGIAAAIIYDLKISHHSHNIGQ
jgi:hypothetical protein